MAKTPSGGEPVAIELLKADHRKVEALFEQYEEEKDDSDEDTKRELVGKICAELKVHTAIEEEILYPWCRETLGEDDQDMVEEAEVEHASAKDLIEQLEQAASVDEKYDAKVKVLSEYIKHHVKEEEQDDGLFEKVKKQRDELDALGQELHARKAELMAEMGMEEEAGMPPARGGREGRSNARRGAH